MTRGKGSKISWGRNFKILRSMDKIGLGSDKIIDATDKIVGVASQNCVHGTFLGACATNLGSNVADQVEIFQQIWHNWAKFRVDPTKQLLDVGFTR